MPAVPQRQAPLRQVSLLTALQLKQLAPLAPHWEKPLLWQALLTQQPLQPEVVSQMQLPPPPVLHLWPGWQ